MKIIKNSMTDEQVLAEVSDKDWMKGALLQAFYLHHIGRIDTSGELLDMILDKLGISFHSRIADNSEAAIKRMLADIEGAFREFDSFDDERYTEYLNNQLGRTKAKISNVKNGIFTSERLTELMLMFDVLNSSVEELQCIAR